LFSPPPTDDEESSSSIQQTWHTFTHFAFYSIALASHNFSSSHWNNRTKQQQKMNCDPEQSFSSFFSTRPTTQPRRVPFSPMSTSYLTNSRPSMPKFGTPEHKSEILSILNCAIDIATSVNDENDSLTAPKQ
jgi:hypothetical protein